MLAKMGCKIVFKNLRISHHDEHGTIVVADEVHIDGKKIVTTKNELLEEIKNAPPGSKIHIKPGTYEVTEEMVQLIREKGLTLVGGTEHVGPD